MVHSPGWFFLQFKKEKHICYHLVLCHSGHFKSKTVYLCLAVQPLNLKLLWNSFMYIIQFWLLLFLYFISLFQYIHIGKCKSLTGLKWFKMERMFLIYSVKKNHLEFSILWSSLNDSVLHLADHQFSFRFVVCKADIRQ